MAWTVTNLVIQFIAGIFGGHGAAALAKEHSFGAIGHSVSGGVGGALSGYFLQTLIGTVVDVNGDAELIDPVTQWVMQAIGGLVAGAMLTLVVGFLKHSIDQHGSVGKL